MLNQHDQYISALFVQCQAACLVFRMGPLGEGAKESAARRMIWSAQEQRSQREGETFNSVYIQGRGKDLTLPSY